MLKALARFHADGIAFLRKNSETKYPFLQVINQCTIVLSPPPGIEEMAKVVADV